MKPNSNESLASGSPSQSGATRDAPTDAEKAAAETQSDRVDEAGVRGRDDEDADAGNNPRSDLSRDVTTAHDPKTKQIEANARHADAKLP
jgi:hypothetical protein